jgi:peptide/nickel transport system permease protein
VTLIAIQFGNALGGAVIVETVFSRQGIGRLVVTAITQKDIPVVQGVVLMLALIQVSMNLILDISYGVLDPLLSTAESPSPSPMRESLSPSFGFS